MWELWKERNRRIFRNLKFKSSDLISKIEISIVETTNAYLRNIQLEEGSFTNWDGLMKKHWSKLLNPPLLYKRKNKEARMNCKWEPLPYGWVKLNFDRAARGNLGIASIRCIINNASGHWVAKKEMSIKPTSNNLAELEALFHGLQLCLRLNLPNVIIEGDSQIVLNAIRKCSTPNWVLNSQLEEVLVVLDRLEEYRICHIYREGNLIADNLANSGADGVNVLYFNEGYI